MYEINFFGRVIKNQLLINGINNEIRNAPWK
jgi:hypothetical protein